MKNQKKQRKKKRKPIKLHQKQKNVKDQPTQLLKKLSLL
jgi:hypothetical protein